MSFINNFGLKLYMVFNEHVKEMFLIFGGYRNVFLEFQFLRIFYIKFHLLV